MFDDEDKARIHTRVQARGRRPAGEQWPTNHADCDRAGDLSLYAAQLAGPCPWGAPRSRAAPAPLPAGTPTLADQAAEIARLRRELDRTRMERDILKKAIGIFAEMPK